VAPTGPCYRCKHKKLGCSLQPVNPKTNRSARTAMTAEEFFLFRLKQKAEKLPKAAEKGKQRALDLPDVGEPEASLMVPSLPAPLSRFGGLTLDSSPSSTAHTPLDSPADVSHPNILEPPAPAPPTESSTRPPRAKKLPQCKSVSEFPATTLAQN
jgi:hypothetical protein